MRAAEYSPGSALGLWPLVGKYLKGRPNESHDRHLGEAPKASGLCSASSPIHTSPSYKTRL